MPSSSTGNKLGSLRELIAIVRRLDPRVAAIAIVFLLAAVVLFATCGGCGRRAANAGDTASSASASSSSTGSKIIVPVALDAASLRDPLLWNNARSNEVEDLASLAAHEGAMGLVEAATTSTDTTLRPTAIRAMGYARGWAQLPFLAKAASGKDDEEARLALDSTLELAARQRRAEDPEDAEEFALGCEALGTLARDVARARARRVAAIRALRMMPCPPSKQGELPTDVDAK